MSRIIEMDPVTRIEGHLAFRVEAESGYIRKAYSSGEMFRGFEIILQGRDPLDAQQITQRICGVCPVSHGTASVLAQDMAYGVHVPKNGRLIRNIVLGANYIQSHILHFYQLSALDFIDIAAITTYQGQDPNLLKLKNWVTWQSSTNVLYPGSPFLPRYSGDYVDNADLNITAIKHYLDSLEIRALAHQLGAIFAGKLPHVSSFVPGGVTEQVSAKKIAACMSLLNRLRVFIDTCYLPDVIAVAESFPAYFDMGKGYDHFLSYGVFPEFESRNDTFLPGGVVTNGVLQTFDPSNIHEYVKYSYFSSGSGLSPNKGETTPSPEKSGSYSWIKAPRYKDLPMEVGPLARMMVAYLGNTNPAVHAAIDPLLKKTGKQPGDLNSVLGRHAARALECKIVADQCAEWVSQLEPDKPAFADFDIPESASGYGLTEAPRGALGHWIGINDYKIERYQCVVPTTWNCSPRDDNDIPGPVERALEGTFLKDPDNPLEASRVIRSFDPCIACAVH